MESQGAGRRIDGRFELIDRLGSGGMGAVWRARDIALHREVALKEVRPSDPGLMESDPGAARMLRDRVLREARALARLAHPNVVTIHHIVDSPEHPYPWIVMELVPGQSLHQRLAHGPLPVPEAARIGRDVLSALRAAHAVGIQHRDIKPANVLLRPDGRAVLTDFGIAALRETTSLTATGELIGSPEYIAPERIRGREGDPASDLWSLGMLLYVAVEGAHPLRRDTSLATLVAVMEEPVPPPVRSGPLAPALHAVLVRDPAARPGVEQLDSMLADAEREPPGTVVPAPAPPMAPPLRAAPAPPAPPAHGGPWTPGPSGPPPAGFGPVPGPGFPSPHPGPGRRRRPVRPLVAALAAAVAVAGIVVTAVMLRPDGEKADARQSRAGSGSTGRDVKHTPTAEPSARPSRSEADASVRSPGGRASNLLTPSGVRTAVKALREKMGGTEVVELTVYKDYALASAPTRGNPKLYDRFQYREGEATRSGPGGTLDSDDVTVDVDTVDWDALPALLKKADAKLGVDKPTTRYLIVGPGIIDDKPTVRVYVADEYGGGYLSADFDGTVQKLYPRS